MFVFFLIIDNLVYFIESDFFFFVNLIIIIWRSLLKFFIKDIGEDEEVVGSV